MSRPPKPPKEPHGESRHLELPKASAQSKFWDYLLELAPDLALLQEVCGIPQHVKSRYPSIQQYPVRKLGLVDCLRYATGALTPTFRTLGRGTITAQIDHLFLTDILRASLVACNTGSRQRVFDNGLSDHLPIIADFAREETTRAATPSSV